ncbi:nitrate reductase molybdenum cofactor assembly chaperone [Sciscionella sediminilitoris]|uniref:nitrate reductase molybdenum cofactor assembly chaperone n=1 Tax=Sciscionella sediminilitoris TaxID=1445613 RepID=UPI0004DF263E|nr:nitrate reductase molybdenum cofactor assembly chaperone [Sciscionella sp. SE31]
MSVPAKAIAFQTAAWCLHYPDQRLYEHADILGRCLDTVGPWAPAERIQAVLQHIRADPHAGQHYLEVFDTSPRRGLYLTWFVHGDTRNRGAALAELAGRYRAHGFEPAQGELPDYLPAVLEFSARTDARKAGLLTEFRPALELLHANLGRFGTPYTEVLAAVLELLPATSGRLPEPPPVEQVGLTAYPIRPGAAL